MASKKKARALIRIGYMVKLWVEVEVPASSLSETLEKVNTPRNWDTFVTLDDGVELIDASTEPVQVTHLDRITVNE